MATAAKPRITFREMSAADLERVLRNEFRAYAYPWSRGIFTDCLKSGYDCRVLCVDDAIVGHAILSAAAGEAHLLNVCVRRESQGQGLGRLFVRQVISRARVLGAQQLFLEVRPTNKVAVALYESLGFIEIGLRKDYYPSESGREDALVLALHLAD